MRSEDKKGRGPSGTGTATAGIPQLDDGQTLFGPKQGQLRCPSHLSEVEQECPEEPKIEKTTAKQNPRTCSVDCAS